MPKPIRDRALVAWAFLLAQHPALRKDLGDFCEVEAGANLRLKILWRGVPLRPICCVLPPAEPVVDRSGVAIVERLESAVAVLFDDLSDLRDRLPLLDAPPP